VAVLVPIGAIRAAIIMLERYEAWPMADRVVLPPWLAEQARNRLPGGKHEQYRGRRPK
jgi:hypothetical protein